MPNILALLQARVSSTRLPGKVLLPILGTPMIFRQIERLSDSKKIDQCRIVTSLESSDDVLVAECEKRKIPYFRGNLDDVLDRFYQAAAPLKPDHVVRLTGDCPLIDPGVIDELIDFHATGNYDYSSNCLEPTFPDGLDAEVMTFKTLEESWKNASLKSEREHVTPYIYQNYKTSPKFKVGSFKGSVDLSDLRWTVDEPLDFDFVTQVYQALYPGHPHFRMADVLAWLNSNPKMKEMNSAIKRNEGYLKSLKMEQK